MFAEFLEKNGINDKTIAVGVSGGSDSLGLILMLHEELAPKGYNIIALTVDHRLRPTSSQEAEYVGNILKKHNIEHHILLWDDKPELSSGIEEAARIARYKLMSNWCRKQCIKYIMTAHHLFDQAETFFMRLYRGSGLYGLCGMQEVFLFQDIYILRPLLETNPSVMKQYLQNRKITWIEDESNNAEEYLRVKMRHALPDFYQRTGLSAEQIVKTMKMLQHSRHHLENETSRIIKKIFKNWFNYAYCCEIKDFLTLDNEIKFRILSQILQTVGQTEYAPRAEKIINLIHKMETADFHAATLGHCHLQIKQSLLWIYPEKYELGNYNAQNWKTFKKLNPEFSNKNFPFQVRVYIFNNFKEKQQSSSSH